MFSHQHGKRRAWCQYLNPDLVKKFQTNNHFTSALNFQKFAKRLCAVRLLKILSVTIYTERKFDTPPLRRTPYCGVRVLTFWCLIPRYKMIDPFIWHSFATNPKYGVPFKESRHQRLSHLTPKRVSDTKISSKNISSWHRVVTPFTYDSH